MRSRFQEKKRKRYGTVNGDPMNGNGTLQKKKYGSVRHGSVRYGQGDKFGRTTVILIFSFGRVKGLVSENGKFSFKWSILKWV